MPHLSDFEAFYQLAYRLIDKATKEQVAEVARLLALNVAHYRLKHGDLPLETFEDHGIYMDGESPREQIDPAI